jgi:hypothetical protein
VPEEPGPPGEIAGQHELVSRLRAVVEAKEAENAVLRAELDAGRELSLSHTARLHGADVAPGIMVSCRERRIRPHCR